MLQHEKIILRPLNNNDSTELALLANNKKIWDNLRVIGLVNRIGTKG